jgi:hypothetical protein
MLLRFFRSNGAQMIFLIPFLGIMLWLGAFLNEPKIPLLSDQVKLPLYHFISNPLLSSDLLQKLIAFILVLGISFLLVRLNVRYIIINNRTYIPSLIYVLVVSGIPEIQRLNPALITTFIILFVVEKVLDSYRVKSLYYGFFTAAFMIGLGCLIYPFFIYFLISLWAGVILLRKFNWREWTFTILGFGLPFLFAFSYYFVLNNDLTLLVEKFNTFYITPFDFKGYTMQVYVFGGILTLIMLLSTQFLMQAYSARKIISRRAFSLLFWIFINTLALFFIIDQASVELVYIIAVPISFIVSNYFVFVKATFWGNLFLLLLMLSAYFNQIVYYFF